MLTNYDNRLGYIKLRGYQVCGLEQFSESVSELVISDTFR